MLEENKLYKIKVRSFYNDGLTTEYSSYSSFINAYTKPIEPTIQPATNVTSSSFDANWTLPVGVTQVKLYVSSNNFSSNDIIDGTIVTGSTYTVSGLSGSTEYKYKVKGVGIGIDSNYSGFETITTDTGIRDLVLNANTAVYLPFRGSSSNNTYGSGNGGVVTGSHSYTTGIISGDDTYLNLSADYNWVRITNNSALDTQNLTIDLAFQFTGFKTTNVLVTKYQTITSTTYRRFYIDYYQPTNEFRISLHNPTMNVGDYAQWNVSFTPVINTNYLISLAIDTTNNVIKFFVNGVEQTMNFIGGALGGIAGVDWSTFEQADVWICAYADTSGINSSANVDANIRLFRFGYHKEYRNLATHTQSYNNLFT